MLNRCFSSTVEHACKLPRDLFDVLIFFQHNSITESLKKAFFVYLISGSRPISELVSPNRLDQRRLYENEFVGMTDTPIPYQGLENAREMLISALNNALTVEDRHFLLSFKAGTPNWSHLNLSLIADMPAIQWKLYNIQKMSKAKHQKALEELKRKLFL